MKSMILAALMAAVAVPVYAGGWRTPGESLYGGPSGEANSADFMYRGRLDEALRNGEAGLVGDTTVVQVQTTSGGCLNTQSTSVDSATSTNSNSNIACNNEGDVNATTNINIGTIKK